MTHFDVAGPLNQKEALQVNWTASKYLIIVLLDLPFKIFCTVHLISVNQEKESGLVRYVSPIRLAAIAIKFSNPSSVANPKYAHLPLIVIIVYNIISPIVINFSNSFSFAKPKYAQLPCIVIIVYSIVSYKKYNSRETRFLYIEAEFSASVGTLPPFKDQGADATPKAAGGE